MIKNFKPRLYQETILNTCTKKNTLVVLPTGLGKTAVSFLLAVHRLKLYPNSKILILSPTKPLCDQHVGTFKKHLDIDENKIVLFTGQVKPEKRIELWDKAKVIVSTPQCVTGDTQIFSLDKGPISIKDFVESYNLKMEVYGNKNGFSANLNTEVLGYQNKKNMPVKVTKVWKLPANELVEIKTELTNSIKCTLEHPLSTINSKGNINWVRAEKLKGGDFIGIAKNIDLPLKKLDLYEIFNIKSLRLVDRNLVNKLLKKLKTEYHGRIELGKYSKFKRISMPLEIFFKLSKLCDIEVPNELIVTNPTGKSAPLRLPRYVTPKLAYILGAMIGDGHIGDRRPRHGNEVVLSELYYPSIRDKFIKAVKDVFNILPSANEKKGLVYYSTALAIILEKLGVPIGNKTKEVRVPKFLFNESKECVSAFIGGLFNADGDGHKYMFRIGTTSENLAYDLRWLLLKLNLISSIDIRDVSGRVIKGRKLGDSRIYMVLISGREQLEKFIKLCNPAKVKYKSMLKTFSSTKRPYTRSKEILPVKAALKEAYLDHRINGGRALDEVRLAYHAGYLSYNKLSETISKLNSDKVNKISELLTLPIRWVRIKSIKRLKTKEHVYDLTVDKSHNFISNFIISHNTVENDLINNRIPIEDVSLIVFDEAHGAVGDYAYVWVAKQYTKKAKYPRIIGLTASPGSDLVKIEEVCKNLYIEDIEVRTDNDPDVKDYVHEIKVDWVKVTLPPVFKDIKRYLDNFLKERMQKLKKWGVLHRKDSQLKYVNKTELLKLQAELRGRTAFERKNFVLWNSISVLAEIMKIQHAVELLETQGITALHKYFEKLQKDAIIGKTKAIKNLTKDINYRSALIKTEKLFSEKIQHPKLIELQKIIEKETKANKDIRIIVFNQYRDNALDIVKELNNIEGVKAQLFVGQLKKEETGLSQKEQKQILDKFREGEFNVLVATSVGEQGLDIIGVPLVMFYEPIPSAIRQIQRRGRTGRHESGRVIVLMALETRDIGYEWSAHHKEKRMYRTLDKIKRKLGIKFSAQSTLERYSPPKNKIKVIVDHREKGSSVIKELIELGANINLEKIDNADYLLSSRVGVEMKTTEDFVNSLIDGRLLQQMRELKENFERPLVIVEGEQDIYSIRNVHPNSIRGMLSTIAINYGIPIMFTKNSRETASFLNIIAKREQEEEGSDFSLHGAKREMSLREWQEYIIAALPGVGSTLAKPLLREFKSVKKVINADEKRLQKVPKVGPVKAKKIKDVTDGEYLI